MNTKNTLTQWEIPVWNFGSDLTTIMSNLFSYTSDFPKLFNSLNVDPYPTDQYWDKNGNLILEIPLAGSKKEDISLDIEDDHLVLHVKKHEKVKDVTYVYENVRKKELSRKWYIKDYFLYDKITSSFEDGLLKIVLPVKVEEKKNKKTSISIS